MSIDRLAEGYQPDFDLDREVGSQGELFVRDIARSLNLGSVEVKYEQAASKYGNVYIEFACLRGGEYRPSGIDATEAECWAFVIGRDEPAVAIIAPTEVVRAVKDRALREGRERNTIKGSHPTRGAAVSLQTLLVWLLAEVDKPVGA